MRKAAAGTFLMAAALAVAMATTALLPTAVMATRSLGRRSRFLPTLDRRCSNDAECPDIVPPGGGFSFPGAQCCDGVCVDTSFNANRCGGCQNWCRSSWICCYGECVDSNDFETCGSCQNNCWDAGCFNGVCGYAG